MHACTLRSVVVFCRVLHACVTGMRHVVWCTVHALFASVCLPSYLLLECSKQAVSMCSACIAISVRNAVVDCLQVHIFYGHLQSKTEMNAGK